MSDEALVAFVGELAADPPGPAAGSAAAVVVAMAAALVELAARRSGGTEVAARAAKARARALPLADADARAYAAVLASRGDARRKALARASDVLREIGETADEVRRLASPLVSQARGSLRGEAIAALELADAARSVTDRLARINVNQASGEPQESNAWALRRRVELSGGEVAWDVFGAGPPLVLVHGTPTWSFFWRNVIPPLARDFTVYALDLPGYGDSPSPSGGQLSIATHSRTLAELLGVWGLDAPAVAGHDIGGAIVLRTHLLHEVPFRRIALLDAVVLAPWITPPTRHIQAHLEVYRTMPEHVFDSVTAAHLRTAVRRELEDEVFAAYHDRWRGEGGQAAYLQKVAGFDEEDTRELEPLLGQVTAPVLVVWGGEDAWLDPALALRLRDLLPEAAVHLVEGAGHFVAEDAPEEVAGALHDFFYDQG